MASGANLSARELSCHAATKNKATAASVKNQANCSESAPVARARCFVRGFSRSYRRSTMRFMAMAAERAATMATTIQTYWRSVGQPFGGWCVARAARSAPVSANGSAKMECSNLIISSTVRMRPGILGLGLRLFGAGLAGPAVHIFLTKIDLCENPKNILRDEVVDRLRVMIERRDCRHDHRARLLRAHHIFQMNPAERRVADAENKLAVFFEHDVRSARNKIVAHAAGDRRERAHGARDDNHRIHSVAARGDGSPDIFVWQEFDFCRGAAEKPARQLFQIAGGNRKFFGEQALTGFGNDQMDARHTRISLKQFECFLREKGAACPGHTYGYDLL